MIRRAVDATVLLFVASNVLHLVIAACRYVYADRACVDVDIDGLGLDALGA